MKRRLLLFPLLVLLGAAPALKIEVLERHGKSSLGTIDGFPLLMLRGTQRECGEAHGRLGAASILLMLDEALIPSIQRRAAGAWDRRFVKEAAPFALPARFEEELAAMREGVGRDGGVVTHLAIVAWPAARRWTFSVSPETAVWALKGRWIALAWKDVFAN